LSLDLTRRIPFAELDLRSASGLSGITVPKEFGGAEVTCETLVRVFQILSAADASIGQLPRNHFVFLQEAMGQTPVPRNRRSSFSREVLKGAGFGNAQAEKGFFFGVGFADPPAQGRTDGTLRLNGVKHYCTGALTAHWIPVAALDDRERLVLVYVPRNSPGVEVSADWNAMGQRVTYGGTSAFGDVVVDPGFVVEDLASV